MPSDGLVEAGPQAFCHHQSHATHRYPRFCLSGIDVQRFRSICGTRTWASIVRSWVKERYWVVFALRSGVLYTTRFTTVSIHVQYHRCFER